MKWLCCPGAYGSIENFKVQLAPFVKEFEGDNVEFHFTQGENTCEPPPGFDEYFGPGPHYRFMNYDGLRDNDVLERIRDFPEGEVPEDVLRELFPSEDKATFVQKSVSDALAALYRTVEKYGPFDGIIGYSEGTVIAGTLILDEKRRLEEEGRERQFKQAIFFNGWPPMQPKDGTVVLSDQSEQVIDIPTLHCVGADDPYLHGAMALYNVCDEDTAILFDHGKGHTIPRDTQTLKELGDSIRNMETADFDI
ncbi:Esterase FUS5 [Lachnellula suecica]|uniref:Esterase FUS5 n=1 Tax=Lachnellula suecica TaxID=602035 RepID=A0A8T9BYP3_9HELO|nr:Esterase FUS5 [Lachnellula suecica]